MWVLTRRSGEPKNTCHFFWVFPLKLLQKSAGLFGKGWLICFISSITEALYLQVVGLTEQTAWQVLDLSVWKKPPKPTGKAAWPHTCHPIVPSAFNITITRSDHVLIPQKAHWSLEFHSVYEKSHFFVKGQPFLLCVLLHWAAKLAANWIWSLLRST